VSEAVTDLAVTELDVWRGDRCLLTDVSFDLRAGQAAVLRWRGVAVRGLPFERRREIAYRSHFEGLKKDLTVRENLDFYCALWGFAADPEQLLVDLELDAVQSRRMRQLSAGQKRRLCLATLRVCGASLWILDEPMTNLDHSGRRLVATWIDEHIASGGLALIATHQPDEFACATIAIEL
jgi:heme exporter protein A